MTIEFKRIGRLTLFSAFMITAWAWGQTATPTIAAGPISAVSASPIPTPSVYQMSEVVVTAPADKDVFSGKDLDSLKADSRLADLLDENTGVETEGLGIAKSFANVSIRGSTTNQTLILLNGQRTNQGFDLAMIPTEDIERIEIIKGPAALAYGPDATGGVINVITKVENQGGDLSTSVGDFGTYQVHGSTGDWHLGPWQGSLSGNGFNTNGYTANTDLVNWEADQSSCFDLGDHQLALTAGYVYKNGGAPNGDSLSAFDTGVFDTDDREKRQAFAASLGDQWKSGDWSLSPSFSYNYANVYRLSPLGEDNAAGVPQADQNIYNTYDFLVNGTTQWKDWFHSLSLGFEFRSEQVQGTEGLGDGVRTNDVTSFSIQGLWDFTQALSLQWSGRLDWYNTYQLAEFNPEGTLKCQWAPGADVYASAGTGFRYPDFDELYHPMITYFPGVPIEFGLGESGNPNLQPESSINFEAGVEAGSGDFTWKASGFLSLYTNLIVPAQDLDPSDATYLYWTFENDGQARVAGFETDLNWTFSTWGTLYGGYTFSDSRDTQTNQLIAGRMRDKISEGVILKFNPDTELNLNDQFVDRNPAIFTGFQDDPPVIIASAYSILNADFKARLGAGTKAFLSFKNLLNQQYATVQGLLMPGRYFEAGTTVNF